MTSPATIETPDTMSEMELIRHLGYDRGNPAPSPKTAKARCYNWRRNHQKSRKLTKQPCNRYLVSEVEALTGKQVKI